MSRRIVAIILLCKCLAVSTLAQVNYAHVSQSWNTNKSKHRIPFYDIKSILPRDAIQPIYQPAFWNKREAEGKYKPEEPVVIVQIGNMIKAYPLGVLSYRNVVVDKLAGTPILVTYCPLSHSIMVFDRKVEHDGRSSELKFGTSGMLRKSNTVLWDHQTESWWQQLTGECLVGEYAGAQLKALPYSLATYGEFIEQNPFGRVLEKSQEVHFPYSLSPYYGYDNPEKVKPVFFDGYPSQRLPSMERVIHFNMHGKEFAYPYREIASRGVLNDMPGDNFVVLFFNEEVVSTLDEKLITESKKSGAINVFSTFNEGNPLTFRKEGKRFIDNETQSVWSNTGRCLEGDLKGKQLKPVVSGTHFAFALLALIPECHIYGETEVENNINPK
ncbi:DUF3179 domain-containing protein [Rapidithrix thailandica]|uniref:DUF3179 domain-containing protein n=1 Tax=Rapidithrix thailandica TaxID=413964 RepID=A0AAW9S4Z0_9BACT